MNGMLWCLQGRRHEDSDSEDEWTDEEDDSEALDTADPFLYFADTLRAVQMQHPARFQVRDCIAVKFSAGHG